MPDVKEQVNLFDEEGDGKVDGLDVGTVIRSLGLKPSNAMIENAAGKKYKKGERVEVDEVQKIYDALKNEKEIGSFNDYVEALRVFDKDESGRITKPELKHGLCALGERLTGDQAEEVIKGNVGADGLVDYKDVEETVHLFDDEGDGNIDGTQIGDVVRALGLKPTNAQIEAAVGATYKKGETRLSSSEVQPIYDKLKNEKVVGSEKDYLEALRVFDKEESGKITRAELKHSMIALGERLLVEQAEMVVRLVADKDGMCNYKDFIKVIMAGPKDAIETKI